MSGIDEMRRVLDETLRANALRITTSRGGYVGGGQPHATLDSDAGATEAIARGLLARKVSVEEKPTYCDVCPHAMHLHLADGSCAGGCHGVSETSDE